MNIKKIWQWGLLPRVVIAIVLGILIGLVVNEPIVRAFLTFNILFSQFLGFLVPLIIVGLITSAIGDIGSQAGKLLLLTVLIAFGDTVLSGLLTYTTGMLCFPSLIGNAVASSVPEQVQELQPYFKIQIPPILDVMSALVFSFNLGMRPAGSPVAALYLWSLLEHNLFRTCMAGDVCLCQYHSDDFGAPHFHPAL